MKRKTWMIAFLLCATGIARAEGTTDTLRLTLREAIDIALSEHPSIKVADREILLKKTAQKEAWQNLLPEASVNSRLDHTLLAAEMKLNGNTFKMGEDGSNSINTGLTLNLPLFAPTVYKLMSMTRTDVALAVEKARGTQLDLVSQVKKAYYQLLLAQDSYEVMEQSYRVSAENYRIVSAKYEQGKVSEFDKISAEVQLRSIRPNLVAAKNAISLSALQLKVLMGVTDYAVQLCDGLDSYEAVVRAAAQEDRSTGLSGNTTLKQLALQRERLEKNIRLQRMNFVPTLGMSFNYQYQSIYNKDIHIFGYDWAGSASLLFNLNIPLYRARNFTQMKTARLQLEQLEWNTVDTKRNLTMEAENYRNNMAASTEQTESNRRNVEQAEKAVTIASKRYEVGKGTVLELNNSQMALTRALLVYNQSIYNYLVAKADLDRVMGNEELN